MDGVKVAWRSVIAAHKFFFWALVEWSTKAIYWHKEASREMLVLKPRRPKDLYDAGYVLFAYDISCDGWRGYWRTSKHVAGMPPEDIFEIAPALWGNVPFHEVEFSDMPEISFKVRAVALDWCRSQCSRPTELKMPEVALPRRAAEPEVVDAEPVAPKVVH